MRLRDRQSVLAAVLLTAGYAAFLLWLLVELGAALIGYVPRPIPEGLAGLMIVNAHLLAWRLLMRWSFVTRCYGRRQGLKSVPRVLVSNFVAILAARRAVFRYLTGRRTGVARWDKTAHVFPAQVPAE